MPKQQASLSHHQRLKVLHVAPLPPPPGGMATYIQGLIHSKLSTMTDMRVVRTSYLNKELYRGLRRRFINMVNGAVLTLNVLRWIIMWRPNVVHVQTNSGAGLFEKAFLALISRALGAKTLLHVHGGGLREFHQGSPPIVQALIQSCGRIPDRILVASPQMMETWRIIGLQSNQIIQIRNAVELPAITIWDSDDRIRERTDSNEDEISLLFLTRVVLEKGILELIDAMGLLSTSVPQVRLRIVGAESDESAQVREYIQRQGLGDHVVYVGQVTEEEKQREYAAADLFVFPTHVEDQSYAILEALSHGLPCVASSVGGVPSIIDDGINGILVPPKDVPALARAIEGLVLDAELRQRLGIMARRTIEDKFTWDRAANEIFAVYDSVLSDSR